MAAPDLQPQRDTVVVLTRENDLTADMVVEELHSRSVPVFRFDTRDFPLSLTLNAQFADGWRGTLDSPSGSVKLESIRSIYFRRPTGFSFPDAMTDAERRFAGSEARRGIGGLLISLPCLWLNHPARVANAEYKPYQLAAAARYGLDVPATMLTNDPTAEGEARELLGSLLVYKPLASASVVDGDRLSMVYATEVSPDFIADGRIALTVHQFQERLPKARDVRATVVGEHVYAANLYSDSPKGQLDWRADYSSIRYERTQLPAEVERRLLALTRCLELRFCAADFVVTPDGRYYFVDLNPNGEWGWIEQETGLPIAAAVAELLAEGQE
ncbi:ATP-grasp ribosomal peptide maturase [Kutzneria buriramensis]|uniref:ATP-grasp ribosomal peptide maturase n=1 Tax=Kutzneria buriramensis TaxID=1045776 RepID=A0A3E0HCW3_9PSEU|nr:ATP-grasp ribosomal peptide maturase [Kutzneria buriramensis]